MVPERRFGDTAVGAEESDIAKACNAKFFGHIRPSGVPPLMIAVETAKATRPGACAPSWTASAASIGLRWKKTLAVCIDVSDPSQPGSNRG